MTQVKKLDEVEKTDVSKVDIIYGIIFDYQFHEEMLYRRCNVFYQD